MNFHPRPNINYEVVAATAICPYFACYSWVFKLLLGSSVGEGLLLGIGVSFRASVMVLIIVIK